jgi:hypothetical protein
MLNVLPIGSSDIYIYTYIYIYIYIYIAKSSPTNYKVTQRIILPPRFLPSVTPIHSSLHPVLKQPFLLQISSCRNTFTPTKRSTRRLGASHLQKDIVTVPLVPLTSAVHTRGTDIHLT